MYRKSIPIDHIQPAVWCDQLGLMFGGLMWKPFGCKRAAKNEITANHFRNWLLTLTSYEFGYDITFFVFVDVPNSFIQCVCF
jgi:hypothetical protein